MEWNPLTHWPLVYYKLCQCQMLIPCVWVGLDTWAQEIFKRVYHPLTYPYVWGWNTILMQRFVPIKLNKDFQIFPTRGESWFAIITLWRSWSQNAMLTKIWEYSIVVTFFFVSMRFTIFVNLSMNTNMVVNPPNVGKSMLRSVVMCAHLLEEISR